MLKFIIYPLLGAFIGIFANLLLVMLMFYPKKKIFGIQGIIENKREILAREMSTALCNHFVDTKSLSELITKEKVYKLLKNIIFDNSKKLPSFVSSVLSTILERAISNIFFENGVIKKELLEKLVTNKELEDFVYKKIMTADIGEIKKIAIKTMGKEILLLSFPTAIFGALIGLTEAFLPL